MKKYNQELESQFRKELTSLLNKIAESNLVLILQAILDKISTFMDSYQDKKTKVEITYKIISEILIKTTLYQQVINLPIISCICTFTSLLHYVKFGQSFLCYFIKKCLEELIAKSKEWLNTTLKTADSYKGISDDYDVFLDDYSYNQKKNTELKNKLHVLKADMYLMNNYRNLIHGGILPAMKSSKIIAFGIGKCLERNINTVLQTCNISYLADISLQFSLALEYLYLFSIHLATLFIAASLDDNFALSFHCNNFLFK